MALDDIRHSFKQINQRLDKLQEALLAITKITYRLDDHDERISRLETTNRKLRWLLYATGAIVIYGLGYAQAHPAGREAIQTLMELLPLVG